MLHLTFLRRTSKSFVTEVLYLGLIFCLGKPVLADHTICNPPKNIADIVECQNQVIDELSPKISSLLRALSHSGSLGCTKSQASAQPAYPSRGDLRCFMVFGSGVTLSTNLVDGLNENHLEVSENYQDATRSGVILGHFSMDERANLKAVLESSTKPLFGSRMSCASCHRPVGVTNVPACDGQGSGTLLTPIMINRTVTGTIANAARGQISPDKLDEELDRLSQTHRCGSVGLNVSIQETCLRISILKTMPGRLPLQQ